MKHKNSLDKFRNSGGGADIGTKEDGAIVETFKNGNRLIIIKEKSVYEFQLADDIDPERKHPNLPWSTHKLLLNIGSNSELFTKIFMTAKSLFTSSFVSIDVNVEKALNLTLEVIQEFNVLDEEIKDYIETENLVIKHYEENKGNGSHSVPSIPNLITRCKTIFQKIDHICQIQMELIREFFPEFTKGYYTQLCGFMHSTYGDDDLTTKFFDRILPQIQLTRNIRNCLDHRKKEITILNFELQTTLNINTPTIEMEDNGSKLDKVDLSSFLLNTFNKLVEMYEVVMPHLCSKRISSRTIIPVEVTLIPEDKRRNINMRFGYWSPLGDGGYYHQ